MFSQELPTDVCGFRIRLTFPDFTSLLCILIFASILAILDATEFNYEDQISTTSSQASGLRKAFTNEWALRIAGGSDEEAARLAAKYGYQNLGRVSVCFL
ncbi:hypothetical protein ANCCAN_23989 [Ancylostoma caninum]|uniref:Peptidase S8 pro-domain domain-containing protein n=1 Tax=Ancylostoma caninum TaxID=29170 RepID=A0A368FDJ4_ANCCA|nr:hypothetical protein ANCCAN_23989 [Ancylostoma caninum]